MSSKENYRRPTVAGRLHSIQQGETPLSFSSVIATPLFRRKGGESNSAISHSAIRNVFITYRPLDQKEKRIKIGW